MQTRHTLILTGLLLFLVVLGIGVTIWFKSYRLASSGTAQPTRSSEEIHTEWIEKTQKIINQYTQDHEAEQARDELIRLTVTAEDRDAHLALVLALEALHQKSDGAETRFEAAVQLFHQRSL